MWKQFKEFALRGNVMDMVIGVIIGTAFGNMINSLVNDMIMPPIGVIVGKVDFSNLYINLSNQYFPTIAEARAAGVATINYGIFLNTLIHFLIVAMAAFLVMRQINRLKKSGDLSDEEEYKSCIYCCSRIPSSG
jgi:large conductance mechanosensitive channel